MNRDWQMKRGLKIFDFDSNFVRHIWELVDNILWRIAMEVTVQDWPPSATESFGVQFLILTLPFRNIWELAAMVKLDL